MSQSNLINKSEFTKSSDESFLIEILSEIQQTPQEYWENLLEIVRVFRKSVTIKPELISQSQQELDKHEQKILNHQHQALKELTKQWLEQGDGDEQTETWESLNQVSDDNPF
ncbi:hypothetical protein NIES22_20190 [Calothrix brevissima NIES-22]|nr:hypothetical protein NIES22_20190 [Calothrix brevissima NIES-22]